MGPRIKQEVNPCQNAIYCSTLIHAFYLCDHENYLHFYASLGLWPEAKQQNKCLFISLSPINIHNHTTQTDGYYSNLFYSAYLSCLEENVSCKYTEMVLLFIYSFNLKHITE